MEIQSRNRKPITYYMRCLHRDIGFLMLGLTIVYALSGVILVYRETDFLKSPASVKMVLPQQMSSDDIARKLHLRRLEVTKTEEDVIYFQDGTNLKDGVYNKATGDASYVAKQFPVFVERLINIHKLSNSKISHWFSVIYGILLMFLAISSFWMFRIDTRKFRRGIVISSIGIGMAVLIILLI
jgi:hypothetical protein